MSLHPLVRFLLCCLMLSAEAAYFLQAHFHRYENTLHAYRNTTSANGGQCCSAPAMSPPNCTDPCATTLWYCFKEYGTISSFSNMSVLEDCNRLATSSMYNTDFIDFSFPVYGENNNISLSGNEKWPVKIQFFVLAKAGDNGEHVVDYLHLDFSLSPEETLANQTLSGQHFGSDVTFTVSFSLICKTGFHGPSCSVYCRPVDSDELGHYSCLSDGSIQCLKGYRNESTNCTECVPAEGCQHGSCDSPGECRCAPGYGGDLCEEAESSSVSAVLIAVGVSVGCLVMLITTALVAVVVLMALQRRRKSHNVDFGGEKYAEKPSDVFSGVQTPGNNPVYDGSMGEHIQLVQSTATTIPKHQPDNALDTLDTQPEVNYSTVHKPPQPKSGSALNGWHPGSNPVYDGSVGEHIQLVQGTATTVPKHQPDDALYTQDTQPEVNYSSVDQPPQPKSGSALNGWHPGSNPVYDGDMGKQHPLGKSLSASCSPERLLDNPLYTMGTRTADQPPQHDYGYASSGNHLPATGPVASPTSSATGFLQSTPPASPAPHKYGHASLLPEEEQLYDAPNVVPRPRPQQPLLTYDYAETPLGTVGSPTAVYDAPLLSDKPATASHDYADTPNVNSSSNTTPPDVPGQ